MEEAATSGPFIGGELIVPINVCDVGEEIPTDAGVFAVLRARAGEASTLGPEVSRSLLKRSRSRSRSFTTASMYSLTSPAIDRTSSRDDESGSNWNEQSPLDLTLCDAAPMTLDRRVRAGGKSIGVSGGGELRDVTGEAAKAAVRELVGTAAAGGAGDG
jgi:hypothetical protein